MKVIFLDIDGVLNSALYYRAGKADATDVRKHIDPSAVKNLNYIVEKSGAKIVVISVWRHGRTIEELQSILNNAGFVGEVIGKTESLNDGKYGDCILRGNEILHWTQENQDLLGCSYSDFKNYVILDDDSDMLYWQRNNFIQVDGYVGLTPTGAWKAVKILNA